MSADDRSPGLAVPDYHPLPGMRSYFTVARVSRDIFRQSSVGALYTDWECPTTGEYNRVGGVDTHLKFNPNWTLDGQAVTTVSSNLNPRIAKPIFIPSVPAITATAITMPALPRSLELHRDGLHFTYDGHYNDISPGSSRFPDSSIASIFARPSRRSTTAFAPRKAGSSTGDRR